MAGQYRSAGGATTPAEDEPDFLWKYCSYFASVLLVASFTLIGLMYSGAIADVVYEAYFFVLRSIDTVFGFTMGMMPSR